MPLASTTGPLTITKPEAGDNVKTHETGTGATGYNHANLDNINAALNATTGHDHDGTDSKKVLATNLDRTGGTARQQLVVNSGATALEYAASMQSLLTAQGDLPYASAANTPARLAKGTAFQGLRQNTGETAPEWATPMGWRITETEVGAGGAANIDFASIPATFRNLEIRLQGRGEAVAAYISVDMRFNADAGASYDDQTLQVQAAVVSAAEAFAQTGITLGEIAAASAPAGAADEMVIRISNYRGTTFQKSVQAQCTRKGSNATTGIDIFLVSGWWRSTAAINQITLIPSSGDFAEGTVVTLYGLM